MHTTRNARILLEIGRVVDQSGSTPSLEFAPLVDYRSTLRDLKLALGGSGMIADTRGVPVNPRRASWEKVVEAIHLFLKDKCPAITVRVVTSTESSPGFQQ
jgi:hypothetical protein